MKVSSWDIFKTFFIIGLTTFGGGYGMLAVMERKLVNDKKWLTSEEMIELLAVSEASPGPFAVNAATFIGYQKNKFFGSVLATLGVVLPSLLVSIVIALILKNSMDNKMFNAALQGISAGVSVIILLAFISLSKKQKVSPINILIFLVSAVLVFFKIISIVYIIIIGAVLGILIGYFRDKNNKVLKEEVKENDSGDLS